MVEAEATMPSRSSGVPRLLAKGFKTGFFDRVELRIAKKPTMQITRKKARCFQFESNIHSEPNESSVGNYFLFAVPKKECGLLMVFSFPFRINC